MNLSLIGGYDRTTLKFMLEQDIPEENKVAIRAELQRRTIASSSQRIATVDSLAPDGAEQLIWQQRSALANMEQAVNALRRELIGRLLNQKQVHSLLIQEASDCLTSLLSEDEDEIHPEATIVRDRLAAALAAAQPASDGQEGE